MAQRNSEYERIFGDVYITPPWVFAALWEVEPWVRGSWDCAPVERGTYDFLKDNTARCHIASNPPFGLADAFVVHALNRTRPREGKVAMLLPHAWDTAKSRRDLFEVAPFKAKYAITQRIRWENLEQKKNGPSSNHAWYVWDWLFSGKPFMGWLPKRQAA